MNQALVLGVDGGGTHTRALLVAADGRVLGQGRGGASNLNTAGFDGCLGQVLTAVAQAWTESGLEPRPLEAAYLGLAGIKASGEGRHLEQVLEDSGLTVQGRCRAVNDTEVALAGGLRGRPGLALIAGTGSFCFGRDAAGQTACCGGWGWLLDDIGGGVHLGREALRAVFFAQDGRGPATCLRQKLLARAEVREVNQLLAWFFAQGAPNQTFASLAPLVTEAAKAEDAVAWRILESSAKGLAELVVLTCSRLHWEAAPEVVLVGGLALSGPPYQTLITEALREALPGVRVQAPDLPPVAGAVLRAFEVAELPLTEETQRTLVAGCQAPDLF